VRHRKNSKQLRRNLIDSRKWKGFWWWNYIIDVPGPTGVVIPGSKHRKRFQDWIVILLRPWLSSRYRNLNEKSPSLLSGKGMCIRFWIKNVSRTRQYKSVCHSEWHPSRTVSSPSDLIEEILERFDFSPVQDKLYLKTFDKRRGVLFKSSVNLRELWWNFRLKSKRRVLGGQ
jgi:hypothetical protein